MSDAQPLWRNLDFYGTSRAWTALEQCEKQFGAFKNWADLRERVLNTNELRMTRGCGQCTTLDIRNAVSRVSDKTDAPTDTPHDELYERVVLVLATGSGWIEWQTNSSLLAAAREITDGIRNGGPTEEYMKSLKA